MSSITIASVCALGQKVAQAEDAEVNCFEDLMDMIHYLCAMGANLSLADIATYDAMSLSEQLDSFDAIVETDALSGIDDLARTISEFVPPVSFPLIGLDILAAARTSPGLGLAKCMTQLQEKMSIVRSIGIDMPLRENWMRIPSNQVTRMTGVDLVWIQKENRAKMTSGRKIVVQRDNCGGIQKFEQVVVFEDATAKMEDIDFAVVFGDNCSKILRCNIVLVVGDNLSKICDCGVVWLAGARGRLSRNGNVNSF